MLLIPILFSALLTTTSAATDPDDVLPLKPILNENGDRELSTRQLVYASRQKPGDLFKFVVANGQLPDDDVATKKKPTHPDIFGLVRHDRKGNNNKGEGSGGRSEKNVKRGPGSVFGLFDSDRQPTSHPASNPSIIMPVASGKGMSKSKSEKKGKGGKGVSSVLSASPTTSSPSQSTPSTLIPTTPIPTLLITPEPTKAPVSAPPTISSLPTDIPSFTSSPSNRLHGKGSGNSSKGYKKSKHESASYQKNSGKGGEKSSSNGGEKSSGKGRSGKKAKRAGKGKGRSMCSPFEFIIDRRRLQFDGASCGNDFMDVAPQIPELSSFLELIDVVGLSFVFSCAGPFSIAAPVNSAFDGIDLTKFSRRELRDIVLNHIFPGILLENDFEDGVLEALNGAIVVTSKQPLQLNEAKPIQTDIIGCNFVSHTIDALLVDLGMFYFFFFIKTNDGFQALLTSAKVLTQEVFSQVTVLSV